MASVIHVLEHLRVEGGGLPAAVSELALRQSRAGLVSVVVELVDKKICTYFNGSINRVAYSSVFKFWNALSKLTRKSASADTLIHLHGVWCPLAAPFLILARLAGLKYVVSFHGQLMPNLLNSDVYSKSLKKIIYLKAVVLVYVKFSKKLHAITEVERSELRRLWGQEKEIHVICNYVAADIIKASNAQNDVLDAYSSKRLLFMARIDPRKGIEQLIRGFALSSLRKDWILHICGSSSDLQYIEYLKKIARDVTVEHRIVFVGLVHGEQRLQEFLSSAAVCLPSVSEVIALSNIEAALFSRLVVTTYNSGFPVGPHTGSLKVECDEDSIAAALSYLGGMGFSEYEGRVSGLRRWALETVSPASLDQSWSSFYGDCFDVRVT